MVLMFVLFVLAYFYVSAMIFFLKKNILYD